MRTTSHITQHAYNTLYLSAGGSVLVLGGSKPGSLHVQHGNTFYTRFAVYAVKNTCKPLVVGYVDNRLVA